MAEITFVIPARNLDTLHRTLSMLAFQKDAGLRAVIVDLVGSEAVRSIVPDFEHSLPVSVVTVDLAGQPLWKCCLDAAPSAEWVCFLTPGVDFNEMSVKRMRRCIDDQDYCDSVGRAAARLIAEHYNTGKLTQELLAFYNARLER